MGGKGGVAEEEDAVEEKAEEGEEVEKALIITRMTYEGTCYFLLGRGVPEASGSGS